MMKQDLVFQTGKFSEFFKTWCQPTFALWFWNHTCTTLTVSPVSAARVSLTCNNSICMRCTYMLFPHITHTSGLWLLTFRQGLEDTSKEALKARRCCVVRMVRGLFDLLWSFPSPAFPPTETPPPSSSSLFTAKGRESFLNYFNISSPVIIHDLQRGHWGYLTR